MNSRDVKKKANAFRKEFGKQEINFRTLQAWTEKQGYTVVEFNHIFNDAPVAELIEALHLSELTARSRGFTYADRSYRIVFVHEDLSEAEKLLVLAHEIGHIYCGHMAVGSVIGSDVREEYEANEFAHYLLHESGIRRLVHVAEKHKKAVIVSLICLALIVAAGITFAVIQREKRYYREYYITETGSKYHKKNCIFVKDKTNVSRLTLEEFESGSYEPCSICLP